MRRAPPGRPVSSGRLRVDAARAVDKLRDYQLPDAAMWVLEVIRSAVLARAESIRVYGDADDVVVAWEGPPFDDAELTRLFDELVDPASDRRALRLLATGVNTALGLEPRFVDVARVSEGEARAVRYTPRLLRRAEDGSAPGLRSLAIEPRTPHALAPARGMLVHLRRLPLLGAVPILFGMSEPAELAMVRRACADIGVPLVVGNTPVMRDRSHVDLLRVELGEGLDGFLALTDPSAAEEGGRLDVAELGVLLARYALPLEVATGKLPLRLFVDAPRMPTNASRSAVPLEDAPVRDAVARARELVPVLVSRLATELGERSEHAWSEVQRERLRAAAIALLAACAFGDGWRANVRALRKRGGLAEAIAPLASLPLLRDAVGRARAPASFAKSDGTSVVHDGADPLPIELAHWVGEVLWAPPGDPAAMLLGGVRLPSAKKLVSRVRGYRRARERWLERAVDGTSVAPGRAQLLAVPLVRPGASLKSCASAALFSRVEGLEGEVVLCDPRATLESRVSLRVEGREIESLACELPVPIVAAAQCARLAPNDEHTAARRDEVFEGLFNAVRGAAVVACEALALRLLGISKPADRAEPRAPWLGELEERDRAAVRAPWLEEVEERDRAAVRALIRGGIALAIELRASSGTDAQRARAVRELSRSKSSLFDAEVWPVLAGGFRSTRALWMDAERGPAVGLTRVPGSEASTMGARTVYVVPEREQPLVRTLVGDAPVVDYDRVLTRTPRPRDAAALARELCVPGGASLAIPGVDHDVAVAWTSGPSAMEVRHFGVTFEKSALVPSFGALRVVVEDERVVPDAEWSALSVPAPEPYPVERYETALARAFADALDGDGPSELVLGAERAQNAELARAGLLACIAKRAEPPEAWLGRERATRLREAPLVALLGVAEPVGLDALVERFPTGPIPWLPRSTRTALDLGDWHPIHASEPEVAAYARLLDRELVCATDELERRRLVASRRGALARHRKNDERDPSTAWSPPVIAIAGEGFRSAKVALAASGQGEPIEVRIEGRPFATLDARERPLRVTIDFEESAADAHFRELTPRAQRAIEHVVGRGTRELVRHVLREDPSSLVASSRANALLCAWARERTQRAADRALAEELARAPIFPSVQGALASLEEAATEGGTLRVASFDAAWLAPEPGERESAYDRAILRMPSEPERAAALRELAGLLWTRGPVRDVSGAVARLQSARRAARGLTEVPRLASVKDPRFRRSLDALLEDTPELAEVLVLGEAALDDRATRLTLVEGGLTIHELDFDLVPRVRVAASSPLAGAGRPIPIEARERLADAVREVTAQLVRRVIDETPPAELPEWLRRALRESCLLGGTDAFFDPLRAVPLFETTSSTWVTPDDVRAQHARFGPVSWTHDASITWAPLDDDRVALRLRAEEASLLAKWIPLAEASEELRLDQRARQNRDRAPVASLDLELDERGAALVVGRFEPAGEARSEGIVALLRPDADPRLRGMQVHRAMRPLGRAADPSAWPCVARVEDPDLTPNRTWDAPARDGRLAELERRVRALVDRELLATLPFPSRKVAALRVRAVEALALGLASGAVIEGVFWLEREIAPGSLAVTDASGKHTLEPTHAGRALPLSGTLLMYGARFGEASAPGFVARIYAQLVRQAARRVPSEPDPDHAPLAHLLHGIGHGVVERSTLPETALPCFAPSRLPLAELLAHLDAGSAAERTRIDDGSPVARELAALIAQRAPEPSHAARPYELAPNVGGVADRADEHEELVRLLHAYVAPEGVASIELADRAQPLARLDGWELSIARAHPLVVAVEAAIERGDPDAGANVRLLAARALGRREKRIELAFLERLLE